MTDLQIDKLPEAANENCKISTVILYSNFVTSLVII